MTAAATGEDDVLRIIVRPRFLEFKSTSGDWRIRIRPEAISVFEQHRSGGTLIQADGATWRVTDSFDAVAARIEAALSAGA